MNIHELWIQLMTSEARMLKNSQNWRWTHFTRHPLNPWFWISYNYNFCLQTSTPLHIIHWTCSFRLHASGRLIPGCRALCGKSVDQFITPWSVHIKQPIIVVFWVISPYVTSTSSTILGLRVNNCENTHIDENTHKRILTIYLYNYIYNYLYI